VLAPSRVTAVRTLQGALIGAAHSGGGWPYYQAKQARIEPTCWALLALAAVSGGPDELDRQRLHPHLGFLTRCQRPDGLLIDTPSLPNFTANGLAACALTDLRAGEGPALNRLLDALSAAKGVAADNAPDLRQDNRLQAWPWMPDTFSWLEPTAWCLLALKKARAPGRGAAEARIQEADRLIANRSCATGGWNFGNASALGQDLRPYVPTTALALIAMQDRQADPVVQRGLAYLKDARLNERSAFALALTALCLRIYGAPADDVESQLIEDAGRAQRIGNIQALAMMLYALSATEHGGRALRI